jgi:hypothetical protein
MILKKAQGFIINGEIRNKNMGGCTSSSIRHKKIRNKALNEIDSDDNKCDLQLYRGCKSCCKTTVSDD